MKRFPRKLFWFLAVFIVVDLIGAVIFMGWVWQSSDTQRDKERIKRLVRIEVDVTDYYREKQTLPVSLYTLYEDKTPTWLKAHLGDPETGDLLEYHHAGETVYKLCAKFDEETPEASEEMRHEKWQHGEGQHCFIRVVTQGL
ncbi:MAG: hypothetical protein KTR14_09765 [Vampirovibrio sp.]|nr:hypothetical protein [Vampirovibrio sp.]